MTLQSVQPGFVSTDRTLVDFFVAAFELEELEPLEFPQGTVHRLGAPDMVLKVMVPDPVPARTDRDASFLATVGLNYVTVRVDDLDAVIERATARGATIVSGPREIRTGARIVLLLDPDGNTLEVLQEG